jgi:hypothetical protein
MPVDTGLLAPAHRTGRADRERGLKTGVCFVSENLARQNLSGIPDKHRILRVRLVERDLADFDRGQRQQSRSR